MFPLTFALLAGLLSTSSLAETLCNGRSEFCDRRYSDISFIGAHNSPFVGPLPQHNQDISVTAQLDLGIRYLQGQTHKDLDGSLNMCHTSCLLENAGTLQSFFETVKTWLDGHKDEVVTLLVTNGDRLSAKDFDDAAVASGIKDYAFTPPSSPDPLGIDDWPTLGELIETGNRLILFLDYEADMKAYPYILDEFAYYFETPFSTTDPSFDQCEIDRPPDAEADGRMFILNHSLNVDIFGMIIPDRLAAPRTNAATGEGSIGEHANLCHSLYSRNPNVVFVDFLTEGNVFKAQKTMNGF